MKKTTFTLSVVFLAAIFFASCSNLKNLSIEKRHYGKGYYVSANGKHHTNDANKPADAAFNEEQGAVATEEAVAGKVEVAKAESAPVTETPVAQPQQAKQAKNSVTTEPVVTVQKNHATEDQKTVSTLSTKKGRQAADDVSTILLVLLCILLPPLAVYLVDGLGTNFWIDLILCLFFWLPGIIFAFIVCFA